MIFACLMPGDVAGTCQPGALSRTVAADPPGRIAGGTSQTNCPGVGVIQSMAIGKGTRTCGAVKDIPWCLPTSLLKLQARLHAVCECTGATI